jgi:hypothetical protein
MSFRALTLSTTLCAGLLAGFASAQSITAVTSSNDGDSENPPVQASVGSVLTITGMGFGTAKPKVFLTDGENKKYALKVTEFDDTHIVAEVKKAVAGDLTLNVQPKGLDALTSPVTIQPPSIHDFLDAAMQDTITSAGVNTAFVITGEYFGTKKGKIKIGGKAAKVLEWADDMIHVVMPKALANGEWTILLDNKTGVDDDEAIVATGSLKKVGKVALNVTVGTGGNAKEIHYKLTVAPNPNPDYIPFGGALTSFPQMVTGLVIKFNFDEDSPPLDIESGAGNIMVASFTCTMKGNGPFGTGGDIASWLILPGAEGLTAHITSSGGGQVGGTFEADLPMLTPANSASALFGNANPLHIEGSFVYQQAN